MKTLKLITLLILFTCMGAAFAGKVNVNTADAELIAENLKGIGPVKARAIVAYRKAHGGFSSVEELVNVPGIGAATLEKNRDNIVLSMKSDSE